MRRRLTALVLALAVLLIPINVSAAGSGNDAADILEQAKEKLTRAFEHIDEETGSQIFTFLKDKIEEGALESDENLEKALREGEEKFGIKINREDAKELVATMERLEKLGFSAGNVVEKAAGLYEEYGAGFVDHVDEIAMDAVKNAVSNAAGGFFDALKNSVKNFFKNLFS